MGTNPFENILFANRFPLDPERKVGNRAPFLSGPYLGIVQTGEKKKPIAGSAKGAQELISYAVFVHGIPEAVAKVTFGRSDVHVTIGDTKLDAITGHGYGNLAANYRQTLPMEGRLFVAQQMKANWDMVMAGRELIQWPTDLPPAPAYLTRAAGRLATAEA